MHNCPLWAPKQTSARIDFLRQGKRLVDKKALIMLKFLLKVRQNDYAACTREWATAQRTRTLATASASGCRACCPRPTETTPCKRRSNLPLAARLSTCRERMEQLPPGRFLKHSHVLPQTNGKHPIFAVFFRYVLFPTFVQKNMFALNETNVYRVCCTPVDMRQGILRLCQFVRGNDFNPSDGCVYVFYNRPRNRIKLLHWERCGFVVYHKQMAQGCLSGKIMQQAAGFYELRWDELVLYMEGINPRCYRRKRYNKP